MIKVKQKANTYFTVLTQKKYKSKLVLDKQTTKI